MYLDGVEKSKTQPKYLKYEIIPIYFKFEGAIEYGSIEDLSGLRIGGGSGFLSEGRIDEVRIWNKVLTQSQIQQMMNYEIARKGTGTSTDDKKVILLDGNKTEVSGLNFCEDLNVYYKFNEESTTHAAEDSSCNNNSGNYENMDDTNIGDSNTGRRFVSTTEGSWLTAGTWDHNEVPTSEDYVLLMNQFRYLINQNNQM
jgi:hypothetical protein